VQQHRQLRSEYFAAQDVEWNMSYLFGPTWEKNQHIEKSGDRSEVDKCIVKQGGYCKLFGVTDSSEWWEMASKRTSASNGDVMGQPFYFGVDWVRESPRFGHITDLAQLSLPTALDPRKNGRFKSVLDECEVAVSLVCLFALTVSI
jgi:hypothetical protein